MAKNLQSILPADHNNVLACIFTDYHKDCGFFLFPQLNIIDMCVTSQSGKELKFESFLSRINSQLLNHPIITENKYCQWFALGRQNIEQIKNFIVEFSVFSNQFLIAQTQKMINAPSLDAMRASKEILANEIGVIFKPSETRAKDLNQSFSLELMSCEGSVEGSIFKFQAGHFEWLMKTAEAAGLTFDTIGRRKNGNPSTLSFCDSLINLYGSEDYQTSVASSFAIENWANKGFWKELIAGFDGFNSSNNMSIPTGFFVWHDKLESQHAVHTLEELEGEYFACDIDEDKFIVTGNKMLDALKIFWDGLESSRIALAC